MKKILIIGAIGLFNPWVNLAYSCVASGGPCSIDRDCCEGLWCQPASGGGTGALWCVPKGSQGGGGGETCDPPCVASADYVPDGDNVEKLSTGECIPASRTCEYRYRCAAGYYGELGRTRPECSPCPQGGQSTPGANHAVIDCFVESGSDETGTYTFTAPCHYEL